MSNKHNQGRVPFGGSTSAQKPAQTAPKVEESAPAAEAGQTQAEPSVEEAAAIETTEPTVTDEPKDDESKVESAEPPVPIIAKPVTGEKRVIVRPRKDVPRVSIGGTWYSFRKGVDTYVSPDVERILRERDII